MSGIYALANYDLDYIYELVRLQNYKVKIDDLSSKVVLVSNKGFLSKNIEKINKSLNKKTYFVFGSPRYLEEFNITQLNISNLTKAKLRKYIEQPYSEKLVYKKQDLVKKLLRKAKVSIIRNIQTLLYRVQNKEVRSKYRNLIFSYLNSEKNDIKNLENSIILVSKKKSSLTKELIEIIHSDLFSKTHDAVISYRKDVNAKSKISKFDINYILSFKSKVD